MIPPLFNHRGNLFLVKKTIHFPLLCGGSARGGGRGRAGRARATHHPDTDKEEERGDSLYLAQAPWPRGSAAQSQPWLDSKKRRSEVWVWCGGSDRFPLVHKAPTTSPSPSKLCRLNLVHFSPSIRSTSHRSLPLSSLPPGDRSCPPRVLTFILFYLLWINYHALVWVVTGVPPPPITSSTPLSSSSL